MKYRLDMSLVSLVVLSINQLIKYYKMHGFDHISVLHKICVFKLVLCWTEKFST